MAAHRITMVFDWMIDQMVGAFTQEGVPGAAGGGGNSCRNRTGNLWGMMIV